MPKSKQEPCKFCFGKGFATVMESIYGAEDFGGEGFRTEPKVFRHFCTCTKGKRLKAKAIAEGKTMVLIGLYE